jgi:ATP-binding cassette, subfamily F, member 3
VFVSHDRYFIDRLATRVLEVENGTVMAYEGNYEDYLRKKEGLAAQAAQPALETPSTPKSKPVEIGTTIVIEGGPEPGNGTGGKARRLNPIKQKQMEDRCAFLEEEVPRIESALAHTEQQLGIFVSAEETQRLTKLAEDLRTQRDTLAAEWEDLMLQLEA